MLTLQQYKQDQARTRTEAAAAVQACKDQAAAVREIEWKYAQLERELRNEKNAAIASATKPAAPIDYTTAREYRELLELYPLLNAPAPEPAGRVYFHESWRLTAAAELGTPGTSGGYPVRVLAPVRLITAGPALNISVYIAGNKKPTNCFTVIIAGNSIFNLQANDGGVNVCTDGANIRRALKDFPTLDAARAWIERAPDPAIVKQAADLYQRLEELRKVAGSEWRAAWVEYRLEYYRTQYSHYQEQPEYQALLLEQNGGE
jgi:hypothetical protein